MTKPKIINTDFRALCEELVSAWDSTSSYDFSDFGHAASALVDRARTALAVEAVGPSDEELESFLVDVACQNGDLYYADPKVLARAVLARYGSAPHPIPVGERLNDAQLEEIARAFSDDPVEVAAFICGARWAEYKLKPGPAHALPIPTHTGERR